MTVEELYIIFRREQGTFFGRGFRLPKDISTYIETKFTKPNKEALYTAALWFSTKWQNIDPSLYFKYGFELYGNSFSYTKFFDEKVIKYYITKDKTKKFNIQTSKKEILESLSFIFNFMKGKEKNCNFSFFQNYCKQMDGKQRFIIQHYIQNKISPILFVYFLNKRYIILKEDEKMLIPILLSQQREITEKLVDFKILLEKAEEQLNGKM